MNLDPQPGDKWSREGFPPIEVVAVKGKDIYYSYGKEPRCDKLDRFRELAAASIQLGAVLRRGNDVFSKDLEDFEV